MAGDRARLPPAALLGHHHRLDHGRHNDGRFHGPLARIGYPGGATLLFLCVLASLAAWRWTLGTVSVRRVRTPRTELFYWLTITLSQTLGTALGDWAADAEFGYGGALVFAAALRVLIALYLRSGVSQVVMFWAAFILTRPLGATLGDLFDKPVAEGGLAFSRPLATAVLAGSIILCLLLLPQRPARPDEAH